MTRHLISETIYRIVFAAVAALILCAPSAEAQIVAFDFEDLVFDDDQPHRWGSNLVNDGWSLTTPFVENEPFEPFPIFIDTVGLQHRNYAGSTAVRTSGNLGGKSRPICKGSCFVFEREDGQTFSMESIDISPEIEGGGSIGGPTTVNFQGFYAGSSGAEASASYTTTSASLGFERFSFAGLGFENIVRLEWANDAVVSPPGQFDNITVVGSGPPVQPEISLSQSLLTPAVLEGGDAPDQMFTIGNTGGGTLDYTITDDVDWLAVNPTDGTSDGELDTITVSYDTDQLPRGPYAATITVSDPNASNDPQTINVFLIVTALPAISLSESSLMPETPVGGDAPPDTFLVTNSGGQTLNYEVTEDADWLSVDPPSGILTGAQMDTITVTYATSGLPDGTYQATIVVTDEGAVNDPQTIDVTMSVGDPVIALSTDSLTPAVLQGNDAPDQTFTVSNTGAKTLDYTITDDAGWLVVDPASGTSTGELDTITVSYYTDHLALGPYTATITVSDPNASNDPQTIDVMLIVTALPAISLSESSLMPETPVGGDAPPETFTVANVGGLVLIYDVTVQGGTPWLSVDPTSGNSTGEADTITVTYDTASLPEGPHNATLVVSDPLAANNPQMIDVALLVPEPDRALSMLAALFTLALLGRPSRAKSALAPSRLDAEL